MNAFSFEEWPSADATAPAREGPPGTAEASRTDASALPAPELLLSDDLLPDWLRSDDEAEGEDTNGAAALDRAVEGMDFSPSNSWPRESSGRSWRLGRGWSGGYIGGDLGTFAGGPYPDGGADVWAALQEPPPGAGTSTGGLGRRSARDEPGDWGGGEDWAAWNEVPGSGGGGVGAGGAVEGGGARPKARAKDEARRAQVRAPGAVTCWGRAQSGLESRARILSLAQPAASSGAR
jgi:hypothetical protein